MEQLNAFLRKAIKEEALMDKLNKLGSKDAGDDEIIKVAAENGFTVTKEEIEEFQNQKTGQCKLNEEDLKDVAGGDGAEGWPTEDRFDPKVCPGLRRTRFECVGLAQLIWCDHLWRVNTGKKRQRKGFYSPHDVFHHKCQRPGGFDYEGCILGDPF